jgi:hypothetical protein
VGTVTILVEFVLAIVGVILALVGTGFGVWAYIDARRGTARLETELRRAQDMIEQAGATIELERAALNMLGTGLESISRGGAVQFSRDEQGNIVARPIEAAVTIAGRATVSVRATATYPDKDAPERRDN